MIVAHRSKTMIRYHFMNMHLSTFKLYSNTILWITIPLTIALLVIFNVDYFADTALLLWPGEGSTVNPPERDVYNH